MLSPLAVGSNGLAVPAITIWLPSRIWLHWRPWLERIASMWQPMGLWLLLCAVAWIGPSNTGGQLGPG
jgi:hypothetical protein